MRKVFVSFYPYYPVFSLTESWDRGICLYLINQRPTPKKAVEIWAIKMVGRSEIVRI